MVLRNYVELPVGIPTRLRFSGGDILRKTIIDPLTGREKSLNSLVLHVVMLNGQPVSATLSTLAEKLAAQLMPFIEAGTLANNDFIITKSGKDFATTYSVELIPRT